MVAGTRLCPACRKALAARIASLPGLFDECGNRLSESKRSGDKVSGGSLPGMPFNAAAAEVRSEILGVLSSWAGMVAHEQGMARPARSPVALASFLRRNVAWIAAHETAADATDELATLERSARRVAFPTAYRRVDIGPCVEAECTGLLVAHVRTGSLAAVEVACDADPGHRWQENEWLELSRRTRRAAGAAGELPARWLSCAQIARLWHVSTGTVYRLASEDRWRRRSRRGRVTYHESDVRGTFLARASPGVADGRE